MANLRIVDSAQQVVMDAFTALIDAGGAGSINIYSGVQPTDPDDAVGAGTLLAELTFSADSFGNANASGVATANAITGDAAANDTGTATWARILSGGSDTVFDCDVGVSGATINLDSVSIIAGATVDINRFTLTMPSGV